MFTLCFDLDVLDVFGLVECLHESALWGVLHEFELLSGKGF